MRTWIVLTTVLSVFLSQGHADEEVYDSEWAQYDDAESEPIESPEQIQKELDDSEKQFARAEKMFVPWYTGPLITTSPSIIPPGTMMLQPYVFVNDYYGAFNNDRHAVGAIHDLINLNPFVYLETGITDWMDVAMLVQAQANWRNEQSGGGIGDLQLTPGFKIYQQTRYIPQIKVFIQETFPTGAFDNLNPYKGGLDATGSGSYKTQIGLVVGKLLLWQYQHPLRIRLSMGYTIPSNVRVSNFNTYGGGFGTRGTIKPGKTFSTDLGIEWSLTQQWVFAMDVVYSCSGRTTFSGYKGTSASGSTALIGSPSSDNLSLAPAFEYNWSQNLGVIGGVQFSVYGRNSSNFVSGIISVCYVFNMM